MKLHGNSVAGYNSDGAGTDCDDPYTLAGAVFDGNCSFCDSFGNTWGGGINDPASNDGPGKQPKWGVFFFSAANNSASNERSSGELLSGGALVSGLAQTYPQEEAVAVGEVSAEVILRAANAELDARVRKLEAAQAGLLTILARLSPRDADLLATLGGSPA